MFLTWIFWALIEQQKCCLSFVRFRHACTNWNLRHTQTKKTQYFCFYFDVVKMTMSTEPTSTETRAYKCLNAEFNVRLEWVDVCWFSKITFTQTHHKHIVSFVCTLYLVDLFQCVRLSVCSFLFKVIYRQQLLPILWLRFQIIGQFCSKRLAVLLHRFKCFPNTRTKHITYML